MPIGLYKSGVYQIRNKVNGKVYIGSTIKVRGPHTPEAKAKMRAAKLGKKQPEEQRRNGAIARTGLKKTAETRFRMSQAQLKRLYGTKK